MNPGAFQTQANWVMFLCYFILCHCCIVLVLEHRYAWQKSTHTLKYLDLANHRSNQSNVFNIVWWCVEFCHVPPHPPSLMLSLHLSLPVSLSLSPCQPLPLLFSNAGWFVKKIRKNKRSLKVIYLLLIYTDNLLQYFPAILGVHIPRDKIMVSPCFSKFLHSSYSLTSLRILLFWQYLLTHI